MHPQVGEPQLLNQPLSTEVDFATRGGYQEMETFLVVITGMESVTDSQWVVSRDPAPYAINAQEGSISKNCPPYNAHCTKTENPFSKLSLHSFEWTRN